MAIHRNKISEVSLSVFESDIYKGLSASEKSLPSKYFYDRFGDELFIKIMNLDEYYLTRSELEIMKEQGAQIIEDFSTIHEEFDVYELGAGDGSKTVELLQNVDPNNCTYYPIDISLNALEILKGNFNERLPNLNCEPLCGDYFKILGSIESDKPKLVLFLGSNLGNLSDHEATEFLTDLAHHLNPDDGLLLGLDTMKSKDIILPAYNDSEGVTKAFNLNLLARINREMDANFNLHAFSHDPVYDEEEGVAYSYLTSLIDQTVYLGSIDQRISFAKGEKIHTEISRKYDATKLEAIVKHTGLEQWKEYTDRKNYFKDHLLRKERKL